MDPKFNTRDFNLNVSFNPPQLHIYGVPTRQDKKLREMPSLGNGLELSCNQLLPRPKPLVNDDSDHSNGDADDGDDDAAEGMLKQNETR